MRATRLNPGLIAVSAAIAASSAACGRAAKSVAYQTVPSTVVHQSQAAREANEAGLGYAESGQWDEAEASFRAALRADVGYAAAHNNLGLVLFQKKRLHEAAMEFRMAAKLDPHAAEPVVNLGRLFEAVGWKTAAEVQYQAAESLRGQDGKDRPGLADMGRLGRGAGQ